MALIKCPECGKEISDKAERCPLCGCPKGEFESNEASGVLGEPKRELPREMVDEEKPEMFECYKCGRPLPVSINKCVYCGYVYHRSKSRNNL